MWLLDLQLAYSPFTLDTSRFALSDPVSNSLRQENIEKNLLKSGKTLYWQ